MSACYDVTLCVKVKDEKKAFKAFDSYIKDIEQTHEVNFKMDSFFGDGKRPETLDDIIRLFLAGWKCTQFTKKKVKDGFVAYENSFNASYGWESVMINFFRAFTPHLEDESYMIIYPNEDYDEFIVRCGQCISVH